MASTNRTQSGHLRASWITVAWIGSQFTFSLCRDALHRTSYVASCTLRLRTKARVFFFFVESGRSEGRGSMLCDKVEAYCLPRKIGSCSVSDESASRSTIGSMCVKRNLPTRQSGWKRSNWNEVVCLVSFFVLCRSLVGQINILFRPKLYFTRILYYIYARDTSFRLFTVLIFIFSASKKERDKRGARIT